jgi:hypothetical protein
MTASSALYLEVSQVAEPLDFRTRDLQRHDHLQRMQRSTLCGIRVFGSKDVSHCWYGWYPTSELALSRRLAPGVLLIR